jgi:hypothetical protein
MLALEDAMWKLYGQSFGWSEFTVMERKNLEKLESQVRLLRNLVPPALSGE